MIDDDLFSEACSIFWYVALIGECNVLMTGATEDEEGNVDLSISVDGS